MISINDNISNNEIDNHHFAYSYNNDSIFKRVVELLNHVHNIIEPSTLDISNPSEPNTAVIDSSSGVQSSVQSSIQSSDQSSVTTISYKLESQTKKNSSPPNSIILST
ncbi:1266_t:CDS:2, partial [Gigaspora rosea]